MSLLPEARLMDGTALASQVLGEAARRAERYLAGSGRRPCLAAVLVGEDPASVTYVRMKRRRCEEVGIEARLVVLPAESETVDVIRAVRALSQAPDVDGVLVQHPVPGHIDERAAFEAISPEKDVDGVTMRSFAAMSFGLPGWRSCTPEAIVRLLDAYEVELEGRRAVVVGRSPILGKPVGMLLLARNATVTYCHSRTRGLADIVGGADVVVAAVGRPRFVCGDWVKSGAVVLDAGYNPGNVGDVDSDGAGSRASLLTPVPGGVGPMTVAVLLEQTVDAADQRASHTG
jgi:methylenetetrahydrofolate dehydrogenase (NADP+)/methenyltetrahydrofolate cyclohydrolase